MPKTTTSREEYGPPVPGRPLRHHAWICESCDNDKTKGKVYVSLITERGITFLFADKVWRCRTPDFRNGLGYFDGVCEAEACLLAAGYPDDCLSVSERLLRQAIVTSLDELERRAYRIRELENRLKRATEQAAPQKEIPAAPDRGSGYLWPGW